MVPFSYSVLCRALDARTYRPKETIPIDEQETLEDVERLADAKSTWSQIIHYVVSCGHLEWTEKPMTTSSPHGPVDSLHDSDEETSQAGPSSTAKPEGTTIPDPGDDDESSGASGQSEDAATNMLFNSKSNRHILSFLEKQVLESIPHARYRAPVFYVLNFASCVLSLCIQHRRALGSSPIHIRPLAAALIEDIKEFFGPRVAIVAADLFKTTIHCAEHFPRLFDVSWLTFDLDRYNWVQSPDRDVVKMPEPKAQGILFTTVPEDWLMTDENRLRQSTHGPAYTLCQPLDDEEHESDSDEDRTEDDQSGDDTEHDESGNEKQDHGSDTEGHGETEDDGNAEEQDAPHTPPTTIGKRRRASTLTSPTKRPKLSRPASMNVQNYSETEDEEEEDQVHGDDAETDQSSGDDDDAASLSAQPLSVRTGIKLRITPAIRGDKSNGKRRALEVIAGGQEHTEVREETSKKNPSGDLLRSNTRSTRSSAKRVAPEDDPSTPKAKRSRRR